MKTLTLTTIILLLTISCGGGGSSSTSVTTLPEQAPSGTNCFSDEVTKNIQSVFNTLASKGNFNVSADFITEDTTENNGSGKVLVTKNSDSNWHMLVSICDSLGNCTPQETDVMIKDRCLFYQNVQTNVLSSDSSHLKTEIDSRTDNGEERKDLSDISIAGLVSMQTSVVVDGRIIQSFQIQEKR